MDVLRRQRRRPLFNFLKEVLVHTQTYALNKFSRFFFEKFEEDTGEEEASQQCVGWGGGGGWGGYVLKDFYS